MNCLKGCITLENTNMTPSILNRYLETAITEFFDRIEPFKECFGENDNKLRHFSDNEWMANAIERFIAVSDVDIAVIIEYLKTSDFYQKQKYECEQKIIKWLIMWIMEGRSSWIAGEEYGEDFLIFHEACDLGFHDGIVNALVKAGMSLERAEEGLEYNSDLWFEKYIGIAFNNRYDPIYMMNNPHYVTADAKHRDYWLKLRRFAYYHYHKDIMDKYGNITSDMLMTIEEAREMYKYVQEENIKRKEFLESIHNKLVESLRYADDSGIEEKKKLLEDKQ